MQFADRARAMILLVATKDIVHSKERRLQFGHPQKKSFDGEGLDLEWLDE